MAQQFIDYTAPDADFLDEGAQKINANFTELYSRNSANLPTPGDFGAVGDGVTNDLTAVSAWWAAGGGWVDDTYFVSGNIGTSPGAVMFSDGRGKISGSHQYHLVPVAAANIFSGVILEMTHIDSMPLAFNPNATKVLIQNCIFRGSETNGIVMDATGIAHVRIVDNLFDGIGYGVITNVNATDLFNLIVSGNQMVNLCKNGVDLNHPGTAGVGADRVTITGNYFNAPRNTTAPGAVLENSGIGVSVAGATDVSIASNVFFECRNQGVHVEDQAYNVTIANNIIRRITGATLGAGPNNGLQDGIHILDGTHISVIGNTLDGCEDYGIRSGWDASNALQPNSRGRLISIQGNSVRDCTRGIVVGGNFYDGDIMLSGNICEGNYSAGIRLDNTHGHIVVSENICNNQTEYGIDIVSGSRPNLTVRDNITRGNGIAPYRYDTPGYAMKINTFDHYAEGVVATGFTPYSIAFPLGVYAKGAVYVTVRSGASESEELYEITWDGTTLTGTTPLHSRLVGSLNPEIRANAGNLEMRTAFPTNGATVAQSVRFDGAMLYRG